MIALYLIAILLLVGVDQLIKLVIATLMTAGQSIPIVEGVFHLTYHRNYGGALGLFGGMNAFMTVAMMAVLAVVGYLLFSGKVKSQLLRWCMVCIMAGGAGNLIDRLARGFVVDYLDIQLIGFWVFNFADILVTCATALAAIYLLWIEPHQVRKKAEAVSERDETDEDIDEVDERQLTFEEIERSASRESEDRQDG